jgi:hypothetical protein
MRWNVFAWSRVDPIAVCRHQFQGMHSQLRIGIIRLNISQRAEGRYGVLPYHEFHETRPARQAGFGQPTANIGDGNRKYSTFNAQHPTPLSRKQASKWAVEENLEVRR